MGGIVAGLLAIAPAAAQPDPSAEGRWRSERPALTLDIARCTEGFCGVAVDDAGRCAGRVLTFAAPAPAGGMPGADASGRLQLPTQRAPLDAQVTLVPQPRGGPPMLTIVGVEPGIARFMRRTFPFEAHMARVGEATCVVRPVS